MVNPLLKNKINLYQGDALELIKQLPDKSVDLIMTDPPYEIKNTNAGGHSDFSKSIQKMNDQIKEMGLCEGINPEILPEMLRVCKKPNIYIWCNGEQIPQYIDFFVNQNGCKFDIIVWNKTNAPPTFNNKYLTDKEYCLYFRKGGYCCPENYEDARTVYYQPINTKDKNLWNNFPNCKPLNIVRTLIKNSTQSEDDVVLDCFLGSGTTGVACEELKRNFIGFEINPSTYNIANDRIKASQNQLTLF